MCVWHIALAAARAATVLAAAQVVAVGALQELLAPIGLAGLAVPSELRMTVERLRATIGLTVALGDWRRK